MSNLHATMIFYRMTFLNICQTEAGKLANLMVKQESTFRQFEWIAWPTLVIFAANVIHYFTFRDPDFAQEWQTSHPSSDNKPYGDFFSFYELYKKEHSDPMCRLLHIMGTTLVLLGILRNPKVIGAFISAGYMGHVLFPLLRFMDYGIVEGAVVVVFFLLVAWRATGSWAYALYFPLCGYFFAWLGHFGFEHNRPATFIYPSWSLASDFYMYYETMSGKWALLPELQAQYGDWQSIQAAAFAGKAEL